MYSVLKYIGKKEVDLRKDLAILGIDVYCEPFAGSFNTGFKLIDSKYECRYILNDKDSLVYNFWIQMKNHSKKLENKIKAMTIHLHNLSEKEQKEYITNKLSSISSIESAAAEFLFRESTSLKGFNYTESKVIDKIDDFDFFLNSEYCLDTEIYNKDYKDILQKYDSKSTFFFIDPPYIIDNINNYYRCDSKNFNHKELFNIVKQLRGKWLLTYNYSEDILEEFKEYNIKIVERKMFGRVYRELYIRNYTI